MEATLKDFQSCLGQIFLLSVGDYSDELELTEVESRNTSGVALEGREAFSIVLQSRKPEPLVQKIYHMSHHQLGEFELFIVPIAQNETGVVYEAVFS